MKYWYMDNWAGTLKEFPTLRQAKAAAAKETGMEIRIYHAGGSKLACVAQASGHTPA